MKGPTCSLKVALKLQEYFEVESSVFKENKVKMMQALNSLGVSLSYRNKEGLLVPHAGCLCLSHISFFMEMELVFKAAAQNGLSFITKLFSYG